MMALCNSTSSPARASLNRSFTDEGCDQPETATSSSSSSSLTQSQSSHNLPQHLSLSPYSSSRENSRSHRSSIMMDRILEEDETICDEEQEPSMSDILGYSNHCNNTRAICGVKVLKTNMDGSISGHGSRCGWMSQTTLDSAFEPLSPTASMTNSSVSTHTSISLSAQHAGWTMETKLARSQERRKRLEGRFQRERSKRKESEGGREQVFKFVKGLLLGLEEEEKSIQEEDDRSNSTRGKSLFEAKKSKHERDTSYRTMSSIREFLLHQDATKDPSESESHEESDHQEEELEQQPQQQEEQPHPAEQEPKYNLAQQKHQEEVKRIEADSAHKVRILMGRQVLPESPSSDEYKEETEDDESDDESHVESSDESERSARSSSPSEYSTDSSYYTSEAEDEFPELPVKFKSVEELKSDEEKEDDVTEDTSIMSLSSLSHSSASERELREKDLRHAEELKLHKEELESLQIRFELSTQEHYAELDSLERRYRDESLKREDLLERALTYAEHLEATGRKKSKELADKQKELEDFAHKHFQTMENVRREQQEALRKQKKELTKGIAATHAKYITDLKKAHQQELLNQFDQVMDKCTETLAEQMQKSRDDHQEDLVRQRKSILRERINRHAEEVKKLKKRHEQDLDDQAKIHEDSMRALRKEYLNQDQENSKHHCQENERLLAKLREQEAMIAKLRGEGNQKDEELSTLRQTVVAHESQIQAMEEENARKGQELQKVRESLDSSQRRIRKLELADDIRQQAAEDIATANAVATASGTKMIRQLQEELRERDTHIAELEKDLKKQLEEAQRYHIQENDSALEDLQTRHTEEMRQVQIVLDETKEKHAADVAVLVSKMNVMELMLNDPSELTDASIDTLEKEIMSRRSSFHRRRKNREYDAAVALNKSGYQSKMLEMHTKKNMIFPSWLTPAAMTYVSPKLDLDSTAETALTDYSTSCPSSTNSFADYDDRSLSTVDSRREEEWRIAFQQQQQQQNGTIVSPLTTALSPAVEKKRAAKKKAQASLLSLMGGFVTTTGPNNATN